MCCRKPEHEGGDVYGSMFKVPSLRALTIVFRRPLDNRMARLLCECLRKRIKRDTECRLRTLRLQCYVSSKKFEEYMNNAWAFLDLQASLEPYADHFEYRCSETSEGHTDPDELYLTIHKFKTGYTIEDPTESLFWARRE